MPIVGLIAATTAALLHPTVPPPPRVSPISLCAAESDLNALMTALNAAVANEDYAEAGRIKKLIDAAAPAASTATSWDNLPTWLLDRLEGLDFRYPTPIQSAALNAARAGDAVLSAPTGSGKTLAALCPLLVLCAAELIVAERAQLRLSLLLSSRRRMRWPLSRPRSRPTAPVYRPAPFRRAVRLSVSSWRRATSSPSKSVSSRTHSLVATPARAGNGVRARRTPSSSLADRRDVALWCCASVRRT